MERSNRDTGAAGPMSGGYFVPLRLGEAERDISLSQLFNALLASRRLIAAITSAFFLAGTATALLMTPVYRAEALLLPVSDGQSGGSLRGIAGELSGLVGLAGLDGGSGGRKAQAIATLQSRVLTETYLKEKDLLPVLFSDLWDGQRWTVSDPDDVPTLWAASTFFSEDVRSVVEDRNTGLVRIAITWKDPVQAAQWANDLVARTNEYLRQQALQRSTANIAYLQSQLKGTALIDVQQSVYRVLEGEIKSSMLAQGTSEFAFQIVDPAVPPEEWVRPKRLLFMGVALTLGFLAGCAFVIVRRLAQEEPAA